MSDGTFIRSSSADDLSESGNMHSDGMNDATLITDAALVTDAASQVHTQLRKLGAFIAGSIALFVLLVVLAAGRAVAATQSGNETELVTYALEIGRAVQQECRDRSRMPSSA
eukprot:TRINITY_DN35173_c0_g1_i6.p1 TRINITY_DN35173_c0_g1~~TRINITY_DN35173_c0_g1_i6.p1  ORF type:complete len:112 (-),score=16.61 TRINITY_DN35173_c0_g1_i6:10-345(-)